VLVLGFGVGVCGVGIYLVSVFGVGIGMWCRCLVSVLRFSVRVGFFVVWCRFCVLVSVLGVGVSV
jgi:hypothetical protein